MHATSATSKPLTSLHQQAPQKGDDGQEPESRLPEELSGRSPVFLSATTSTGQRRGTEPVRPSQMSAEKRTVFKALKGQIN